MIINKFHLVIVFRLFTLKEIFKTFDKKYFAINITRFC